MTAPSSAPAPAPIKQDTSSPRTSVIAPHTASNVPHCHNGTSTTMRSTSINLTVVDAVVLAENQRRVGASSSNNSVVSSSLSPPLRFGPLFRSGRHVVQPSDTISSHTESAEGEEERNTNNLLLVTILEEVLKLLAENDGDFENDDHFPPRTTTTTTTTSRTRYLPSGAGGARRTDPHSYSAFLHQQQHQ